MLTYVLCSCASLGSGQFVCCRCAAPCIAAHMRGHMFVGSPDPIAWPVLQIVVTAVTCSTYLTHKGPHEMQGFRDLHILP